MKKNFFFWMTAIAMLIMSSCQKEVGFGTEATVSFEIGTPEIATRAYSDGTTATVLQYAVYDAEGNELTDFRVTNETINISKTVNLQLTTGNTYSVIFWAAAPNAPYTVDFATKTMTVDYSTAVSNDENRDAFYKFHEFTVTGAQTEIIELRRPFAQLNIGTGDLEASKNAGYEPKYSFVKVSNVYNTLDLVEGKVSGATEVVYSYNAIPTAETFPVTGYDYLAMNYLLVASDKEVVDVEFGYTELDAATAQTRTVGSVPVQRNHRTNIYGQLLTSDVDITVIIEPAYDEEDYNANASYVTINGTVYNSFADAMAAVQDGETIKLEGTITLKAKANAMLYAIDGKNVTIDLNDYSIIAEIPNVTKNTAIFQVKNGGALTIEGEGNVKVETAEADNCLAAFISNEGGEVNLKGGYWTMTAISYAQNSLIPTFVDNNSNVSDVTLNIYDGTYTFNRNLFRNFANAASHNNYKTVATMNIYGGTFNGLDGDAGAIWNQKPSANAPDGAGVINVMGGVFNNVVIDDDFAGNDAPAFLTVTSADELTKAIADATTDVTIFLGNDIVGNATALQKANVKVTIIGNDKKFNGVILVDGKSARYSTTGLTISNINFEGDDNNISADIDAYVRLGNGNDATRYTNNVTVNNCTFTNNTDHDMVAVKSYKGGDFNLQVIGCTVNAGMHSLLQVANVEQGLKVENCKVYSENGINLNSTPTLEMDGCTFDVKGYAVRVGVKGSDNTEAKTFTISNSNLKSACAEDDDAVIVIRQNATYATLNLTNTTLTGTREILGATTQTTIKR